MVFGQFTFDVITISPFAFKKETKFTDELITCKTFHMRLMHTNGSVCTFKTKKDGQCAHIQPKLGTGTGKLQRTKANEG